VDNFLVIRSALAKNPVVPSAKRVSISAIAIDQRDTASHGNRCDSILPRIRIIGHRLRKLRVSHIVRDRLESASPGSPRSPSSHAEQSSSSRHGRIADPREEARRDCE